MTYEEFCAFMERWLADLAKKPADEWAVPAIEYCQRTGMMVGDDSGNFRPQSFMRREEVAAVLKGLMTGKED